MTSDPRLSQRPLSFGPRPVSFFPDETVYSFCSRDHLLVGTCSHELTAMHHFGYTQIATVAGIPWGIDHFVSRNSALQLSPEEVIYRHTIAPFYLPFTQRTKFVAALNQIRFGTKRKSGIRLMLDTNSNAVRATLKQCDECVVSDIKKFSTSYWHLVHQLPGVWICPIHQSPLHTSPYIRARKWQLPRRGRMIEPLIQPNTALVKLASFSCELMQLAPGFAFCHQGLKSTYATALKRWGRGVWMGEPLSLMSWNDIGKQFSDHLRGLRVIPSLQKLPASPEEAAHLVAVTLKSNRSKGHPIVNLSLMTWLFPSFQSFMQSYQKELAVQSGS